MEIDTALLKFLPTPRARYVSYRIGHHSRLASFWIGDLGDGEMAEEEKGRAIYRVRSNLDFR